MIRTFIDSWTYLNTWTVLIAGGCAASCALVGAYLVLRRMSMMGDAISHAVLPGLAGGFLLVLAVQSDAVATALPWLGEWARGVDPRHPVVMLGGAVLVGLCTTAFTQWVHGLGRVDEGAALGVVFTGLFAVGLILLRYATASHHVDLDASCVLYGALDLAAIDTWTLHATPLGERAAAWLGPSFDTPTWLVPRAAFTVGAALLLNIAFVVLFYKELKLASFDPQLATTLGFNATAMHYALMTVVAVTTVAAFEVVGSILVIAMLIVPPATAYLLTHRLGPMLALSALLAAGCAAAGHVLALTTPTLLGSTLDMVANWAGPGPRAESQRYADAFQVTGSAGMMAAATGGAFVLALLFSPRNGALVRAGHRLMLRATVARDDALASLYRAEERGTTTTITTAPAPTPTLSPTVGAWLRWRGLIETSDAPDGGARLTDAGRERGRQLIRLHRLWETYLVRHAAVPADHGHTTAERLEHVTGGHLRDELDAAAGDATRDPLGKPIPPA